MSAPKLKILPVSTGAGYLSIEAEKMTAARIQFEKVSLKDLKKMLPEVSNGNGNQRRNSKNKMNETKSKAQTGKRTRKSNTSL